MMLKWVSMEFCQAWPRSISSFTIPNAREIARVEEAVDAARVEAGDLAPQGTLGHAGLLGAGGNRVAEAHDRPQ
jgi:hypothetical protein